MILWVIAGLLALATGMRIGWTLVNRQSVVSSAMIVALGSLAVLAVLNWPPMTRLVDTTLNRPNISMGLSQLALIASAAGSCVMITSVSTSRPPAANRRLAVAQYGVAVVIAAVSLVLFLSAEPGPNVTPREYLDHNVGFGAAWLVPLLYVMLCMTLVSWVGVRLSNPTRRGRALFLFSAGTALIVATAGFFLIRAAGAGPLPGVGAGATLLLCAMTVVATGSLLPSVEDWVGARREMHIIAPLQREMERRHPDVGIGVRPRGPLMFRVAERLSLISDALYLEATRAGRAGSRGASAPGTAVDVTVDPIEQARSVARWILAGPDDASTFPGRDWLRQPSSYSDRDWILEIARQYRALSRRRGAGTDPD